MDLGFPVKLWKGCVVLSLCRRDEAAEVEREIRCSDFGGVWKSLCRWGFLVFPAPHESGLLLFHQGWFFWGGLCIVLKLGQGETQGCDS